MRLGSVLRVAFAVAGLGTMLFAAGCEKKQVKDGSLTGVQDAAMQGEDLALSDTSLNFTEPSDTATFRDIYFSYDSSEINGNGKTVLANVSGWLQSRPEKHLLIEGHCDERGTKDYNLSLGEQRALAARRYLAGLGIDPQRLHTISYGEERPAVIGHSESAWQRNRRAHFLISE